MGKFYEMYEMDACWCERTGIDLYERRTICAGFPEKNYQKMRNAPARNGHKVVMIEQAETPPCSRRGRKGNRCKDTVVRREDCGGGERTMIDRVMVESCPDASHVLAISEFPREEGRSSFHIGVCARNAAGEKFVLKRLTSQWEAAAKKRVEFTNNVVRIEPGGDYF